MAAKSKVEVPKGQTKRPAGRTSLYAQRGSPIRVAADRAARVNSAILEIMRKSAKFPPELAHGSHQDAE
jgi:hypothetical protein